MAEFPVTLGVGKIFVVIWRPHESRFLDEKFIASPH